MASHRYRNRAGDLKPASWHFVTVERPAGDSYVIQEIRPLESIRAARRRLASAFGVREHRIRIGSEAPAPRDARVMKLLKAAIADATAGRFVANPPDLGRDNLFDYTLEVVR